MMLTLHLENYEVILFNKDVKLLCKQTLLEQNNGPPKINPNDIYINERDHTYFYIGLLCI